MKGKQGGFDMQKRRGNKGEGWCGNFGLRCNQILNNTLNVVTKRRVVGERRPISNLSLRRNQQFANANRGSGHILVVLGFNLAIRLGLNLATL